MANIILTSYCNLHCPYCFASEMIQTEKQKNITLEQFKRTLDWISDEEIIGLIGGEPTLHPQFGEILNIIEDYSSNHKDAHFILFTNGIYLDEYLQDLPNCLEILVNVNQPSAMTPEQFERMNNNIKTMSRLGWLQTDSVWGRTTLGCNLCQEITDYSFFFDIVKKYGVSCVRMSVTAPTKIEDKLNKFKYYEKMKPIFLDFMNTAWDNQISISPDCNQIPLCMLDENEKNKFYNASKDHCLEEFICNPVIDITIDFKASSCFGAYKLFDCSDFNNSKEFKRYILYKVMYPRILHNNTGKCKTCKKHELMQCQGGCLAFSEMPEAE